MEYIAFHDTPNPKIAILAINLSYEPMAKAYLRDGLIKASNNPAMAEEVIAYKLPMMTSGSGKRTKLKAPKKDEQREFLKELLELLDGMGVTHIIVTQPDYYKTLAGTGQSVQEVGTLNSTDKNFFKENIKVTYCPNHKMVFFDPVKTKNSINLCMKAVIDDMSGTYNRPGKNIIKTAWYPRTIQEISDALDWLLYFNKPLTADIEGFSLNMHDAGIGSISFAWNKHEGVAFQVDVAPGIPNLPVRALLAGFFRKATYKSQRGSRSKIKFIWHQASYDVTVLSYQLGSSFSSISIENVFDWLTDLRLIECTKIISYLATNSCAGNKLSLKEQALEFAGNYAVEVKDITKLPLPVLLEYNLMDALSTYYVGEKNIPIMKADKQEKIYKEIFKPALKDVIDMQLTGLPVNMKNVKLAKKQLQTLSNSALKTIKSNSIVSAFKYHLDRTLVDKKNSEYKVKRITIADVDEQFNPASSQQLQKLLFDPAFMGLPVLFSTPTGAPSTKGKELKALKNHTQDPDILAFLDALMEFKDVAILLSTFIPALEGARLAPDGNYYMHGSFNLGGTVSGRMSSSDPNLQNLPSKSRLAKYIKMCIMAPPGWILVGLDFDSLEDKISALQTKDPNKLKIYLDGFDGHCLRAYSYFGHLMPDIDPSSVTSINSIAKKYPDERQNSKAPTFLLTYDGTYHGLKANCGFSDQTAKQIESSYHNLYAVSDDWKKKRIEKATTNGYITAAFDLRVRTPVLKQVILGNKKTPTAAKAEARTAGNAMGQSWGLLNNRACSEFMKKVRDPSFGFRKHIKLCCHIHDAQYYLVREDVKILKWFNDNLVKAVEWQNHPEIYHPQVKLTGKVSVFYPTWANEHHIPNNASEKEIIKICSGIAQKFTA